MPKKDKPGYWAVRLNFDYDILFCIEPDYSEWGSWEGPFATIQEARRQIRWWIGNDRAHLSFELARIKSLKADAIRKTGTG